MGVGALHHHLLLLLVAVTGAAGTPGACAQAAADHSVHEHGTNELVVFASAEAHHFSGTPSNNLNEDSGVVGDIVLSLARGRFRLFGEYLVSTEEHDLERFQIGYEPVVDTVLWLGRFHQPASAWNTEHHHGRYLQTAVTRPSVERWEDEDGIVPQHITGLLVDSRQSVGDDGGLHLSAGVGAGPRVGDEGLDPFDLLDAHMKGRHLSLTARISYLPEAAGTTQFGIVAARHRIPVIDDAAVAALGATQLRQNLYGAFVDWNAERWRIVAAAYDIRVAFDTATQSRREDVLVGYVQLERQVSGAFTAYVREENSARAHRSTYVASHPSFELRRETLGARWDVAPRQALTFELGRGSTLQSQHTESRLQWSAAFP